MSAFSDLANHPLGRRLGWALLHSIWQGALGAALFAIVRVGMRRRSANARYLASCAMLVAMLTAPICTALWSPATRERVPVGLSVNWSWPNGQMASVGARAGDKAHYIAHVLGGPAQFNQAMPWLVQIWAVGVLVL